MSMYFNKGNYLFAEDRKRDYVDKSGLISIVNSTLCSSDRFICVTRPDGFGKSMAARMLNAYYDRSCDSRSLFNDLEIAKDPSFETHLNKYPVIYVDITDFTINDMVVSYIQKNVISDLLDAYCGIVQNEDDDLMDILIKIRQSTGEKFIMIIDEWDAILREYGDKETTDNYMSLLQRLFKGSNSNEVFAGVYMTGILPIKKYDTESALNNFEEYSVIDPANTDRYFGFTLDEVANLIEKHSALKLRYDGYHIGRQKNIFNPYPCCSNTLIKRYTEMNFEGLNEDISKLLAGEKCYVRPYGFQNDLNIINSKDDILTILIHLGYLTYNPEDSTCWIPNKEIRDQY